MKEQKTIEELRQMAKALLAKRGEPNDQQQNWEFENLLEELSIHQIELEMQNDELQKAYDRITASERSFSELFNYAPVGYLVLNKHGIIKKSNITMAEFLDKNFNELRNKPLANYIESSHHPVFYKELHRFKSEEHTRQISFEVALLNKNENRLHVKVNFKTLSPLTNGSPSEEDNTREHRNESQILATITDISDQKTLEEKLMTALQDTEKANQAKSDFLANISHEIRTPMNAIIGMAELAQWTQEDSEREQYLNVLKQSATFLNTIINDILDLSKIESGRIELMKQRFSLSEMLQNVRQTFEYSLREKNISLELHQSPELDDNYIGDTVRLKQILFNLVSNAIKFTHEGGITIEVFPKDQFAHSHQGVNKQAVTFRVTDTGIGIPEKDQKKIFQKFTQASSQDIRQYGGTGLGLAISQKLVNLMGGQIHVRSQQEQGSTFEFFVLLESQQSLSADSAASLAPAANELPKCHFLIAEDNPVNMKLTQTILDRLGHTSEGVNNGAEAIQLLRQKSFDMVFMDIEMPQLNGLEATRKIRNGEAGNQGRELPIIALTAHAFQEAQARALDSGVNDFVFKPFTKERIEQILYKYIIIKQK